jgi:Cd2+/Zn2+-exporting ATPase
VIYIIGIIYEDAYLGPVNIVLKYFIFLTSYFIAGYPVLRQVLGNIRKFQIFDENFLMFIATIGAIFTNNLPEAVAVMMFYKVGQMLEDYSVNKSRKSIQSLLELRPDKATVKEGSQLIQMDPRDVKVGQHIVVKPGERVPLDGLIFSHGSLFDTSALTGESVPRRIHKGDAIYAGVINKSDLVEIEVVRPYELSSIARILNLVENAESQKSKTVKFITKFARYYTPAVVMSALLLAIIPPFIIPGATFSEWIYRALIFLVISCPCAMVISIPLSYFAGIGAASRKGILIKGAHHLDTLAQLNSVVFDKTGTITKGVFKVKEIIVQDGQNSDTLLDLVAHAETNSTHPIAKSILEAFGKETFPDRISSFTEIASHGVVAVILNKEVIAGSDKILHKFNIEHSDNFCTLDGTVVHVAVDKKYAGYFIIADENRENSANSLQELRDLGIAQLVMLSGDDHCIVENLANDLGFTGYHAELLPEDKVDHVQTIRQQGAVVAFVGDGINDAPVIAGADVGIAMGGLGSDAAIETADIVLMTDDLSKVPLSVRIARKTRAIIWQNILLIFAVKFIFLALGAIGQMSMWGAVFADVGLTVIAVINAMRALRVGEKSVLPSQLKNTNMHRSPQIPA